MKFYQLLPLLNEDEIQVIDADTQSEKPCVYQGLGKEVPPTYNLKNVLSLKSQIINDESVIILTVTNHRLNEPYNRKTGKTEHEGISVINENGEKMTVLKYFNTENVVVQFEDGTIMYGVPWHKFKNRIVQKCDYRQYTWAIIDPEMNQEKTITMQRAIELFKLTGHEGRFAYFFPSAKFTRKSTREMNIKLNGQTYIIRRYGKED